MMRRITCFWIAPALVAILLGCEGPADSEPVADSQPPTGEAELGTATSSPPESTAAAPESPASVVKLNTVTPEELQGLVAKHKGKVVLFDFWATWCIPCLKQYPHTVELSETHADDLVVYSVSMDETDEETLALVKEKLGEWPAGNVHTLINATGADQDAFTDFEITEGALPHYKVFGRDGKLVAALGGTENVPTPETVDAAVESALGNAP